MVLIILFFVRCYKTRWQHRRSGYFGEWRSIITVVMMCSSGLEKTCRFLQSSSSADARLYFGLLDIQAGDDSVSRNQSLRIHLENNEETTGLSKSSRQGGKKAKTRCA